MSLLTDAMGTFYMIDKRSVANTYGGFNTLYYRGAPFKAAVEKNQTTEAIIAEKQGITAIYRLTTPKINILQHNDVIQRADDGQIFRVKSDGNDSATPDSATLNMRVVNVEQYVLPDNQTVRESE